MRARIANSPRLSRRPSFLRYVGAMAEKPLVLLALFEGLTTTVIDSTILDHARYLVNHDIARCEVWAFCTSKALFKEAQQRLKELRGTSPANVRVFRALRPWVPFSVAINALYFRYQMWRTGLKPDVVHARGDYCATSGIGNIVH